MGKEAAAGAVQARIVYRAEAPILLGIFSLAYTTTPVPSYSRVRRCDDRR
jgi:hypothetical protein